MFRVWAKKLGLWTLPLCDELDVLVALYDKPLCLRYAMGYFTMSRNSPTWPLAVRCCPGISSTHPALIKGVGNVGMGYKDGCRGYGRGLRTTTRV